MCSFSFAIKPIEASHVLNAYTIIFKNQQLIIENPQFFYRNGKELVTVKMFHRDVDETSEKDFFNHLLLQVISIIIIIMIIINIYFA